MGRKNSGGGGVPSDGAPAPTPEVKVGPVPVRKDEGGAAPTSRGALVVVQHVEGGSIVECKFQGNGNDRSMMRVCRGTGEVRDAVDVICEHIFNHLTK